MPKMPRHFWQMKTYVNIINMCGVWKNPIKCTTFAQSSHRTLDQLYELLNLERTLKLSAYLSHKLHSLIAGNIKDSNLANSMNELKFKYLQILTHLHSYIFKCVRQSWDLGIMISSLLLIFECWSTYQKPGNDDSCSVSRWV